MGLYLSHMLSEARVSYILIAFIFDHDVFSLRKTNLRWIFRFVQCRRFPRYHPGFVNENDQLEQ